MADVGGKRGNDDWDDGNLRKRQRNKVRAAQSRPPCHFVFPSAAAVSFLRGAIWHLSDSVSECDTYHPPPPSPLPLSHRGLGGGALAKGGVYEVLGCGNALSSFHITLRERLSPFRFSSLVRSRPIAQRHHRTRRKRRAGVPYTLSPEHLHKILDFKIRSP
jgi:hypothetical protein